MKFLVDTCIWRDYFEDRKDNLRPLGDWAFRFFQLAAQEKDAVFYTRVLEVELEKEPNLRTKLDSAIVDFGNILFLETKDEQVREASVLSKSKALPFADVLQAVIGRDLGAVLVSRDVHFLELAELVVTKKPEDLI